MAEYSIEITEEAKEDLDYYSAFDRKIILAEVRTQLLHEPMLETKNRKSLRENPIASWELRPGRFRIFYEADEATQLVTIVAVGPKEHSRLLIQGKEVKL